MVKDIMGKWIKEADESGRELRALKEEMKNKVREHEERYRVLEE